MPVTGAENADVALFGVPVSRHAQGRRDGFPSWRALFIRYATIDALVMGMLILAAAIPRYVLPPDGLFFDDAWQAAGAVKGSVRDLPLVGQTQPGFTAWLMLVTRLLGSSDLVSMGLTLVAGSVGPALLYGVLRHLGTPRSIATLTAVALVACKIHIQYSSRVKTYPIDVLVVLALVVAVVLLGRRSWTPRTAGLWIVACGGLASLSSTSLIAAGCAGMVLALHPYRDKWWRWSALAGQGAFAGAVLFLSQRSVNTRAITDFFRERDGMIGYYEPLSVPRRTAAHLFHAAASLIDLPTAAVAVLLLMSLAGLALMARGGPHVLAGRFLALCLTAAVGGSIVGLIPMGSSLPEIARVNIWLFPVLAIGFARSASFLFEQARPDLRLRLSGVALALALVLGWVGISTDVRYPSFGARAVTADVLSDLDHATVIWVTQYQTYGFALESDSDDHIVRQTERNVGFTFEFDDPRIVAVGYNTTDTELSGSLSPEVNRVRVISMNLRPDDENRKRLTWHLALSGFKVAEDRIVGGSKLATWVRPTVVERPPKAGVSAEESERAVP